MPYKGRRGGEDRKWANKHNWPLQVKDILLEKLHNKTTYAKNSMHFRVYSKTCGINIVTVPVLEHHPHSFASALKPKIFFKIGPRPILSVSRDDVCAYINVYKFHLDVYYFETSYWPSDHMFSSSDMVCLSSFW